MALEIKSTKDDVIRGIGQSAALVTSVQRAKRIKPDVFHQHLVLLGIDAKGWFTKSTHECHLERRGFMLWGGI